MAGQILIVGRGSFLAGHVLERLPQGRVRAVAHDAIDAADLLDDVGCVINFARHPGIFADGYDLDADDTDVRLAGRIGERDMAYLMLSTRKVYAPGAGRLHEDAPIGPRDAYGRNKRAAEERLAEMLGERLTILRLGNVFGEERIPERRTFLAILLERLAREGRIHYDMSPFVERDFLPVERLADILATLAEAPPGGVLNVGSGIALPTGRLALWILEGFGRGQLVIEQPYEHDPFVLDVTRLRALYGEPCSYDELRSRCLALGSQLARDVEAASAR